ncbi:MAG: hypothetical protein AAFO07_10370 [Bacteroidota bacterium]
MENRWILFILFLALIFSSCKKEEVARSIDGLGIGLGVDRAEDVEIVYSDSAQVRAVISGPLMFNHMDQRENKQEFTDGMKITFYDDNLLVSSILTSKYALRMGNEGKMIVRDSVIWEGAQGQRLQTEEMIWDERLKKIYTNRYVVVTTAADTIYSIGFEANQNFSDIRFQSIEGSKTIEDFIPQN